MNASLSPLPDQVAAQIQHAFPALHWTDASAIDHGWDHLVVILDRSLVLRFPRTPEYRDRLHDEVQLLAALEPLLEVRIPHYTVEADGAAGYPIVRGHELRKQDFLLLNANERSVLAAHLGAFLTTLHTLTPVFLASFSTPRNDSVQDALEYQDRVAEVLPHLESGQEQDAARRIVAELVEHARDTISQCLTHGDLSSDHILHDPEDPRPGIIDFSDRAIDDPAHDFAGLFEYGVPFVEEVYAQYSGLRDDSCLERALRYFRAAGLTHLLDSLATGRMSLEAARDAFRRHALRSIDGT